MINFAIDIPILDSVIAFGFAILFSAYIVIDTQMIIGDGKNNLSLDDWVMGSILLYMDIVGLFLKVLRILGKKND